MSSPMTESLPISWASLLQTPVHGEVKHRFVASFNHVLVNHGFDEAFDILFYHPTFRPAKFLFGA